MIPMGARVFLVDDHEIVRRGLRELIEADDDLTVVGEAGTAAEALGRIAALRPDVAVLDVRLPDGDGIEVCREVRTFSDAYVIMVTARTDEVDRVVGLEVGADDYVTKPFSPRELVARVRAMLRRPRPPADAPPRMLPPE